MQTFFVAQKIAIRSVAGDLGQPGLPQGPINKAIKNSTLRLKTCTKADGEQFEHTKCSCQTSVFTVLFQRLCFAVFLRKHFSAREKSLSDHAKISITSSCLKII